MNYTLKLLFGLACISVTIAAAAIVVRMWSPVPPSPAVSPAPTPGPSAPTPLPPAPPSPPQPAVSGSNDVNSVPPSVPPSPPVPPQPASGVASSSAAPSQTAPPPPPQPKRIFSGPIKVEQNDPMQPVYAPVNQPAYIQFLRQQGKVYHNRVAGRIGGEASKKDWGMRGRAYFQYIYAVESTGKIVKNDGVSVVEERTFEHVHEDLAVSRYEFSFEIPEKKLGGILSCLGLIADFYAPGAGTAIAEGGIGVVVAANQLKVPIGADWVKSAREAGLFKKVPALDPAQYEDEFKMFTQKGSDRILEGKTVRITFKDGLGITEIEPLGSSLDEQERDVVVRTNFIVDHYLFPDRKVRPGNSWTIQGSHLGGFLDPRLSGTVSGGVDVVRDEDDAPPGGEVSKKLTITRGAITVTDNTGTHAVNGTITDLSGKCTIPDKIGVVSSATLVGKADYKRVSTTHLLFEAQTTVTPVFQVQYECEVRD